MVTTRINEPKRLDHDEFGSDRSKLMNVIDSYMLARDSREKPVSTFSHPALDQARRLRRGQTPAEIRLWKALRGRRLQDHKFIRQHPVGPFTVDFLCREAGLVLEVDGATHSDDQELEYDRRRTDYLRSQGYRVLRIQNDDIYHRFDDVMDMILLALTGSLPED